MNTVDFDLVVIGGGIVGAAIAAGMVRGGARVAVVERGPATLGEQAAASPALRFPRRRHLGCERARNHVLGGNGHYWGGGLMRPPALRVADLLGSPLTGAAANVPLDAHFEAVEKRYGLTEAPARGAVGGVGDEDFVAAEIAVLPGRVRNVACAELDAVRGNPRCLVLHSATVASFEVDRRAGRPGRVRAVTLAMPDGERRLAARAFVLAAGVVDTNLIVQQFAADLSDAVNPAAIGCRMHDHWSVPLARIRLGDDDALRALLAPRFRGPVVLGRHFETQSRAGWGARGFLHFTFAFDEVSPYREIKRLMLRRQQRAGILSLGRGALPLLGCLPAVARIGLERWWRRRLFLAKGLSVVATLDFEAFPHPVNALRLEREAASFAWGVSAEDEASFVELAGQGRGFLAALEQRHAMAVEALDEDIGGNAAIARFHEAAVDTFHLGGGLSPGAADFDALDGSLRLRGTDNLHVVSTAAFGRPGVVNPTHGLLALADRFVQSQLNGEWGSGTR
jgi:choline dehydrogenase-like flavoprotein